MKKLFTLLFALVATTALWAHDFEVNGICYNILTDKTNEVEVTYGYCSVSVTIPSTVTYNGTTYSVTTIGDYAFQYCSALTSITIGNSVTSIGDEAFGSCSGLTSVTIPNSVTSIGNWAFRGCSSLTSITIGNSVTSIGDEAFYDCRSLTSIVVEEGNSIYDSRDNCNAIIKTATNTLIIGCQNTTIPNSVTSIGDYAFYYCSGLTSITIPNSVTSIGDYAFYGCSSLTLPIYNAHCFAYMPTSYKGAYIIPEGIKQIAGGAFYYCSSLTSITIPNSVTTIGDNAFYSCSSLTSIVVEEGNTIYDSRENCNAIIETNSNTLILGCQNTIIPNSVTSIGNSAFCWCSGLTSITIPNSVTSIGDYAFYNCSNLTSVTIGNSVTSIGSAAFRYCSSLTSITIGNSVTSIGSAAFSICSSLTSITIPNSVTTIGEGAFENCRSLTSITIPNSVTTIGDWVFRSCRGLTSITIPNSVTSIGSSAFAYCSGLTFIESLAEVPPTLGTDVFYNVPKNIPVYVPCGSVSAYQSAEGWKAFTNIQEPLVEYSIAVGVNDSIMGTSKVDYNTYCEGAQISAIAKLGYHFVQWSDGNTDNPRVVVLTQDTTFTAEFAVSYSSQCGDNLYWAYDEDSKKISITGSGDMYDYTKSTQPWYLFQEQITEVTTSNTTTSIGTSAFEGCIRLGKVSLGYGMENIAANAFAACKRLYDIYVYASYPPFAEESSFANYNVYLYIPCENQRDYILDVVWGNFKFIECIGAEPENMGGDSVVINTGSTDVTIIWPTEENADTYSIVIKKDGKVVCTLTFNSEGQLLNIAFAPGREGNHPAQYAEATTNGYRFTVTGLEEGTDYSYTVTSKDTANKTISEHSGEFTTNSATALDNIHSQSTNCQKILRDGQLLIIRDGKTYNAQGVEL